MTYRNKIYNENGFVKFVRIILLIILSPFVFIYLIKRKIRNNRERKANAEKIRVYDISQINSLSGTEFEKYLKLLFEKMGYNVSLTKKSKDFGADLILEKKGKKTIVQAKCYNHTVGVSAIQEIISARNHYGVFEAIVVSNQNFSKEAEQLANENKVMLAGKKELETLIAKFPVYFEKEKRGLVAMTPKAQEELERKYPFTI